MVVATLVLLVGAPGVAADTPERSSVNLALTARTSDPGTVSVTKQLDSSAMVRVDSAWIGFRELRLSPVRSCDRPPPAAVAEGSFAVELISGRLRGFLGRFDVNVGRYCAMTLGLRRVATSDDTGPAELRGASLAIHGRRADGIRFTLRTRRTDSLRLHALEREGFALQGARTSLILAADVARWFRGVNLDFAEFCGPQPDQILIDEKCNPALLDQFQENLTPGLALFRDRNEDGQLDADEAKRPIAAGRGSRSLPGGAAHHGRIALE